jgi:hypothetical protein
MTMNFKSKKPKTLILFMASLALSSARISDSSNAGYKEQDKAVTVKTEHASHTLPVKESISNDSNIVIIPSTYGGWGYEIYQAKKRYIIQPNIPAIAGNKGFASKEDAQKVAALMLKKIMNHELPPTITIEELNALHIAY